MTREEILGYAERLCNYHVGSSGNANAGSLRKSFDLLGEISDATADFAAVSADNRERIIAAVLSWYGRSPRGAHVLLSDVKN